MNATTMNEMLSTAWVPSLPAPGGAPVVRLSLPGPQSAWRAALQRSAAGLAARLRGHRLRLQRAGHYAAQVHTPQTLRDDWQRLFAHSARREGDAPCAWLWTQPAMARVHARLFADLGLDPRHLLHLRQQSWHPHGVVACHSAQHQRLDCRLAKAVRVAPAAVLLIVKTGFTDGAGRVVSLVEDSYVVRRLPAADAAMAADDAVLRRAIARLRHRGCTLAAAEPGARSVSLRVDAAAAAGFARLAGTLGAARGRPAALQGVHLRNLVARELSRWGLAVSRLSITFVARAHAGQALVLVQRDEKFELADEAGRLVAYGRF